MRATHPDIKVVIVTTHTLMAVGLKHLLAEHFGVDAHITTATSSPLLDRAHFFFCDASTFVSHLDYFLPRKDKTVVIASNNEAIENSLKHINLNDSESDIVKAIDRIIGAHNEKKQSLSALSQREIDVLKLIVAGRINKEIADSLHISVNTVMTHRKNISAKLGIKSVSGLSFYALMNGIAPDNSKAH